MRFIKSKLAGMTALFLIASLLTPLLAFAIPRFEGQPLYRDGSVSGSVYDDVSTNVYGDVYVHVYAPNGSKLTTVTLDTYVTDDVYRRYNFSTSVSNNYNYLNLKLEWTIRDEFGNLIPESSVTKAVYNTSSSNSGSGRGRGGGGGGYAGMIDFDGRVNSYMLAELLRENEIAELKTDRDFVLLPVSALTEGKVLRIINGAGSYELPLSKFDFEQWAEDVDSTLNQLYLRVEMKKSGEDTQSLLNRAAESANVRIVSDGVDFSLSIEASNGNTKNIDNFGDLYVKRSMWSQNSINASRATVALYDPARRTLQFVPSTFKSENNQVEATFQRNGNSTYVIVSGDKSFGDLQNHWARSFIDTLANKLIVEGMTDMTFQPDRNITRAEFAALAVRSLGLTLTSGNSSGFSDVRSGDWYASVVATAAAAGIIKGYEDGTFRPDAPITREELAAMIVRAMTYAGGNTEISTSRMQEVLNQFNDDDNIVWAQRELAIAINAGIVNGMPENQLLPRDNATRAQSTTMLQRYLKQVGFIN